MLQSREHSLIMRRRPFGVRVRFEKDGQQSGWYLARKSNTEPILVMRVEANDQQTLDEILAMIDEKVSPIIDISKLL